MATTIPYPLINGQRHSFASIELKLGPQIFIGFKSIEYSRTRNREVLYGAHPDPLGKTIGENDYKASVELYLAEWAFFQSQLGAGYGDVSFQVLVTYKAQGFDTIQDVIKGCTIDGLEASNSQGPSPLTRKFDMSPLKILFNGVDDLAIPLVGPAT